MSWIAEQKRQMSESLTKEWRFRDTNKTHTIPIECVKTSDVHLIVFVYCIWYEIRMKSVSSNGYKHNSRPYKLVH